MRPLLSIMTPVYNGEDFIKRCYFVLSRQTFTDWEWVVVNDGSTDNTERYIKEINDSRINLVSYASNKGRGYARTEALKAARGKWLVVWDVDDIYFPQRLDEVYKAMTEGYDFVCSYVLLIDNELQVKGLRTFYQDDSRTTKIFVHPTTSCKMSIAKDIGYDPSLPAGEDAALILSLARKYNGKWIHDALALYQEEREVNIYKTISSNRGQLESMKILYKKGILDIGFKKYLKMYTRYKLKLFILNIFRLFPDLYLKTVALRTSGYTDSSWVFTEDKKRFIEEIQKRHITNDWSVALHKHELVS